MNISYAWLRAIAPTIEGTPEQIADRLGMLGAPVDELSVRGQGLDDVLVARVDAVRPHPNADRLRLCTVDAGGDLLQVVCGAPNVVAGGVYPFAPVGATLPGGMQIRKAKIRGESSEGMLCSASELGLGRDHTGLMRLTGDWRPGSHLLENVDLEDASFLVDITPNRGDLLSHIGIARELAPGGTRDIRLGPVGGKKVEVEYVDGAAEVAANSVSIQIDDPVDCPQYIGAIVEGVRVGPSPDWLAARLRAIGARPINNVVDATNWVLHELGQPLHAFDLDTLEGSMIRVRRAAAGETLTTLDGVARTLDSSTLVIADQSRPVAIAGVMGGLPTEVTDGTTRVLIECALFEPKRVRQGAKALGLSTEASQRYERGVDPAGLRRAIERVLDLLSVVSGGVLSGPVLDARPQVIEPATVPVRPERVRQLLGIEITEEEIIGLLEPIGFVRASADEPFAVVVPTFRSDVAREIDVIEEIARRRGYDSFGSELRGFRPGSVPPDPLEAIRRGIQEVFGRWGFFEARTAAFAPPSDHRVPMLNPLSAEESHLRNDLVSGLLRRVEHNWSHGVKSVRLFEIGSVFWRNGAASPAEEVRLAAVFTGPSRPPHWSEPVRPYDVWDLKALLRELAEALGLRLGEASPAGGWQAQMDTSESFALIDDRGIRAGGGGRVVARALDAPAWAEPVWAVEVSLGNIPRATTQTFQGLPTLPPLERDVALVVPAGIDAGDVEATLVRAAGPLLESATLFDVYEGEGLGAGRRSIAWRLRYRHPERTLTDPEVEESLSRVLRVLREEHGVERR